MDLRLAGLALLGLPSWLTAAVYDGKPVRYAQVDGTSIPVRLYGDEFWAVAEDAAGYVLVRDPATRRLEYARLSADGAILVASGVPAGSGAPADVQPRLRPPAEVVASASLAVRQGRGVDGRGRLLPGRQAVLRPAAAAGGDGLRMVAPAATTTGTRVGLTLLARFPDRSQDVVYPQEDVDALLNAPGTQPFGNAVSVRSYYGLQSAGRLTYANLVCSYFTAANPRSYYADATVPIGYRVQELIDEGLAAAVAMGVDLARCDGDGDGVLDAVNLFYAGECPNDWSEGLWPHQWESTWSGMPAGLARAFRYQVSDMPMGGLPIGTFCHESGHLIADLPDLYAYDSNPAEVGAYCLMASGNYSDGGFHPTGICGYLRLVAGWAEAVDLTATDRLNALAVLDGSLLWRFVRPGLASEYLLLEARGPAAGYEGVHGGRPAVAPATGLVAYHCRTDGSNTYSTIRPVARPDCSTPYELLVLESQAASSTFFLAPDPGPEDAFRADGSAPVTALDDGTVPSLRWWSASGRTEASGLVIHGIGAAGATVAFTVGSGTPTGAPVIGCSVRRLAAACERGSAPASSSMAVWNQGGGTMACSAASDRSWVQVPSAPDGGGLLPVTWATAGLAAGTHAATITLSAPGAATVSVPVSVTVAADPSPVVLPVASSLALAATATAVTASVSVESAGGAMSYAVSSDAAWLVPARTAGTVSGEVDLVPYQVAPGGLAAGVHVGRIMVTGGGASAVSTVTLTVTGTGSGGTATRTTTGSSGSGGGCGAGALAALVAAGALAAFRASSVRRAGSPRRR